MHPQMEGFLSIGFHGAHGDGVDEPSAQVTIADATPGGQYEFYFCSTECLRAFFNRIIDELEQELNE